MKINRVCYYAHLNPPRNGKKNENLWSLYVSIEIMPNFLLDKKWNLTTNYTDQTSIY